MLEWKKLGEICVSLKKEIIKQDNLVTNGKYPVVNSGVTLYGRYNEYNNNGNAFTFASRGEYAGFLTYMSEDFWAGGLCYPYRSQDEEKYLTKFIYEYLKSQELYVMDRLVARGGIPALNKADVEKIQIPVPSIAEQTRIVGILDTFTASIENLKQQIAQRRKQYEHYRDQLLDLEGKEGVEMKSLGEVGDICMCKRIMKEQTSEQGDIPFFKIGTFGGEADAYISRGLFEDYKRKFSYPKKGDILISAAGTIGRSVIFDGEDAYFQDSNIVWIDNNESIITNKYLYYLYQVIDWKTDGGTIKRLYNYNLKSTIVPIPSLAEQQRIVSILDTFETSIANLEQQLAQRERQYEYYRNKLLDFE